MPIYFPPLTPDMQEHSDQVLAHLQAEIKKAGGLISFARFMELCLYAPGLGYYSAGAHKLGQRGDFVTAPELTPLFAKSLARQFRDILKTLPGADILELGAGSGIFAKDILLELEILNALPSTYFILETSPDLKERQSRLLQSACPHLAARVEWLEKPKSALRGLIFANEVLDALPLHRFHVENQLPLECGVTLEKDQLAFKLSPPLSPELYKKALALIKKHQLPDGYESEISLLLPRFLRTLAQSLEEGLLLFFDYGYGQREYYHPDRAQGTLRCFYQHRCHNDPFLYPGLQDLTANVDFTLLAEAAFRQDLQLEGYTTQSGFLLGCGITDFANAPPSSMQQYQQNQALKLLMLPSEMGSLIKAIAFSKNWHAPLRGFDLFDKRREL